jgi:hypothetical protein
MSVPKIAVFPQNSQKFFEKRKAHRNVHAPMGHKP